MDTSADCSPPCSPRRYKFRSPSPRKYKKRHASFSRSRRRSPPRRRGSRDSETSPHSAQAPGRYYSVSSRGTAPGAPHRGKLRGSFPGRGFGFRGKPRVESYSNGLNNSSISARDHDEPPMTKRHYKRNREKAEPCRCLGIFGMSFNTSEGDLFRIFKKFGFVDSIRVVRDRKTNRSRGFGFIYFNRTSEAQKAKIKMEDAIIDGMKVRVDYSVTNGSSNYESRSSSRSKMSDSSTTKEFGDPDLSDVKLVVGETVFNVHKMILAFRSKYFKALFYGNFDEKNKDRIEIHDADVHAFERMMEEAYDWCFSNTTFITCGAENENTSRAFWEETTNVWDVLDKFDCPRAMEYLRKLIMDNWCKPVNGSYACGFCINRFVFAKMHDMEFEEYDFNHRAIKNWVENHFDGVPDAVFSTGLLHGILKNIHD